MKGVKALRTWGKVRLYRGDRTVVFRTFVMSIWSHPLRYLDKSNEA
jgi:hypothetical protein